MTCWRVIRYLLLLEVTAILGGLFQTWVYDPMNMKTVVLYVVAVNAVLIIFLFVDVAKKYFSGSMTKPEQEGEC